ncbi:MAG: 50S ribosomal protein L10, partial [Oscillospiraceae bacterium]|nr:50S ribosomal protein L10 [Oscillospiraceae bacterium]
MPSEKILASKQARVAELSELLKKSVAVVLVDYKGITVEQDTKLRKELREAGIQYFVEKNTMLKRAFNENGVTDFDDVLNGTTAISVSENDQTAAARILGEFAEKSETFKL